MKFTAHFRNNPPGLTLVELLVVIAIIGILSSVGFITLLSFNQRQRLNNATNEILAAVNSAKSRAQSQVKPNVCISPAPRQLNGYKFTLYPKGNSNRQTTTNICYRVNPVCGGTDELTGTTIKNLPSYINTTSAQASFTFTVLTGLVPELGAGFRPLYFTDGPNYSYVYIYGDGRTLKTSN